MWYYSEAEREGENLRLKMKKYMRLWCVCGEEQGKESTLSLSLSLSRFLTFDVVYKHRSGPFKPIVKNHP